MSISFDTLADSEGIPGPNCPGLAGRILIPRDTFDRSARPSITVVFWEVSESMGNHDSKVVDASRVD